MGIEVDDISQFGQLLDESEYIKDNVTCFSAKLQDDTLNIDENEILEAGWFSCQNLPTDMSCLTKKVLHLYF